jgi:periplasmic copper chaperone A
MTRTVALLVFAMAVLAPSTATTHDHEAKGMEIVHPWASPTDTASTVVFMTIKNRNGFPDQLIAARATVATKIVLIEAGNGAKSVAAIAIDAGKDVELSSGGFHLLLTGVNRPLHLHDSFKVALEFERVGRVVVDVVVEEAGAPVQHKH